MILYNIYDMICEHILIIISAFICNLIVSYEYVTKYTEVIFPEHLKYRKVYIFISNSIFILCIVLLMSRFSYLYIESISIREGETPFQLNEREVLVKLCVVGTSIISSILYLHLIIFLNKNIYLFFEYITKRLIDKSGLNIDNNLIKNDIKPSINIEEINTTSKDCSCDNRYCSKCGSKINST